MPRECTRSHADAELRQPPGEVQGLRLGIADVRVRGQLEQRIARLYGWDEKEM